MMIGVIDVREAEHGSGSLVQPEREKARVQSVLGNMVMHLRLFGVGI